MIRLLDDLVAPRASTAEQSVTQRRALGVIADALARLVDGGDL